MSKANINTTSNKFTMDGHVKDGTLIYLVYGAPILQFFLWNIKFINLTYIVICKEWDKNKLITEVNRRFLYIN